MKFDISKDILDYEGQPIQEEKFNRKTGMTENTGKKLTWKKIIFHACNTVTRNDDGNPEVMTAENKERAYKITNRAYNCKGKLELSKNDVEFLLDRINKVYSVLIYGKAFDLFEEKQGLVKKG